MPNETMNQNQPPRRWMLSEAINAGIRTVPYTTEPKIKEKTPDSLKGVWWLFELLPWRRLTYKKAFDSTFRWVIFFSLACRFSLNNSPNLGRGRYVLSGQKFHSSVIHLTNFPESKYATRASFARVHGMKEAMKNSVLVEQDLYDEALSVVDNFGSLPVVELSHKMIHLLSSGKLCNLILGSLSS